MDDGSSLPSALAATSLDAHVLSVTAQFVATWFSIVGSDTVSKFHRGVMPGDPEAGQQFTLVISMLLNTLHTQLAMEGTEASVPHVPPDEAIFCLPSALRLRPGTLTFQTSTTLPQPSPYTPTRPSTLSDALFLCSVAFFGNFDYTLNFSAGKNRGFSGCLWPWCLCSTHGSLEHACVKRRMR